MFTLKETWEQLYGRMPVDDWNGQFLCVALDTESAQRWHASQGLMSCYTFNIVTQGWMKLLYCGREVTILRNDFYIYTPRQPFTLLSVSDDFRDYTLMAEEKLTLETPTVRNVLRAAYLPIAVLHEPKVSLAPADARHLVEVMQQIIRYMQGRHHYKQESLRLLYGLFILDALHAQELAVASRSHPPKRTEDLFFAFMRLLPQHFVAHHDINFYSSQLHITPTYLSRIVRQTTGRTVVEYINQMLLMEASFLLRTSQLSIAEISDRLHFSEPASFSRFFSRMNGQTPREFRESHAI